MDGRKLPNRLVCPPPVAEAIRPSVAPGNISPPHSVISAAAPSMTADEEAKRQKKQKAKKQKGQVEVLVAPSPSPGPPLIPEPRLGSPRLLAPETLSWELDPAVRGKKREENQAAAAVAAPLLQPVEDALGKEEKKRKRRKRGEEAASPSQSAGPQVIREPKLVSPRLLAPETLSSVLDPAVKGKKREENKAVAAPLLQPMEEALGKEEKKKRKGRKHEEEAASPLQSAVARAPIFVGEDKTLNVVVPAPEQGKRKQRRVKEQEQSNQSPLQFDVHPQGVKEAAEGPKCANVAVRSCSKYPRMPSNREILRMRIEARKQQPLPEGLLDAVRKAENPSTDSTEKNSNHSSPFGAFFDQFCYEPERRQNRNLPPFPQTPDTARSPLGGHLSSGPSQLAANGTSKAAKTPILNASVSLSQVAAQKKTNGKKQRKPKPSLRTDEQLSDKYLRVPLDQLVPAPRSPHKLLQEKYASDPWKVIVICMLLNLTQGKQVRKIVKGFFKRYPDPHTACHADNAQMMEYLTPLGLQNVKAARIQRFSKDYVEKEWTHITQLCGVGKYAADAYAIFCAGKATEVVPKDHKLVDYWKYVCYELPLIQGSDNAQEPGMTDQLEKVVPKVQELAVCS